MKKSLIDVKNDTKHMYSLRMKGKLSNLPISDYMRYKNIQKDLLKFLPFSVFVLIPVGEIFLPLYLYLFPNATPSQFFSEKKIGELINEKVKLQNRANEQLLQYLFTNLDSKHKDTFAELNQSLASETPTEELKLQFLQFESQLKSVLRDNWNGNLENKLSFKSLSLYEKELVLMFLFKDMMSGVNIINRLYNIPFILANFVKKMINKKIKSTSSEPPSAPTPKKQRKPYQPNQNKSFHGKITLNIFPLSVFRSILLRIQIWHQYKLITRENNLFQREMIKEELEKCSESQIFEMGKRRGFGNMNKKDNIEKILEFQNKSSNLNEVNIEFWMNVLRYKYQSVLF